MHGCRLSNDFLLPTMITFLNDRDWQTRAAFFRDVSCIASQAGFSGMEAFLLPCVEQARSFSLCPVPHPFPSMLCASSPMSITLAVLYPRPAHALCYIISSFEEMEVTKDKFFAGFGG